LNAWDGAGVAGPAAADEDGLAAGADASADAGADVAAALLAGEALGVAGLQPAMTSIKPTTGAMDLNRDTGDPPLDRARPVQHTERLAVG
jgi:hypothetical protein